MQLMIERMLAVPRRDLDAELHVRALVLVRQHLANVVEQRAALRHDHVEPELGGHDAGEMRDFLRVMKDVLTVARAVLHATDQADELDVEPVRAHLVRRLLAHVLDGGVDFLPRLLDHFLDAPRMDASVGDELRERDARDLAAHRIEARDHHRIRRIVDDDVDAGRELERANVSPFAADDPPLHLVVRQRHR